MSVFDDLKAPLVSAGLQVYDGLPPNGYKLGAAPILVLEYQLDATERTINRGVVGRLETWTVTVRGIDPVRVRSAKETVFQRLNGLRSTSAKYVEYVTSQWHNDKSIPVEFYFLIDFLVHT